MVNQFLTTCRKCGRTILMTRCEDTGRWIPCNPKATRFLPSGGPETFIDEHGKLYRGVRDYTGQYGYKRHFTTCDAKGA